MKLIDRYIIRAFITNYVISLAVLMSLFIVVDLLVNLDEFTEDSPGTFAVFLNIVDWYGYNSFVYFSWLAGAITLVAAAFTLGRMVRDNELTAMLASGTSLFRVAAPVIMVGIVLNLLCVIDHEVIIPRIAHKLARDRADMKGTQASGVWFIPDNQGRFLSAGKFHRNTQTMNNLIVLQRNPDGTASEFTVADQATWDADRELWVLSRGMGYEWPTGTSRFELWNTQSLRTAVDTYDGGLTPKDIMLRQASQWRKFLSVSQMNQLERNGLANAGLIQQKHSRITQPIVNMLLLLLGIPFFLTREPRAVLASGAMCVVVGGAFFVFSFVSQHMVHIDAYPALPAWLPILVFGPIVTIMLDSIKT